MHMIFCVATPSVLNMHHVISVLTVHHSWYPCTLALTAFPRWSRRLVTCCQEREMDVEGLPTLGSMVRLPVVSNAMEKAKHLNSVHVFITSYTVILASCIGPCSVSCCLHNCRMERWVRVWKHNWTVEPLVNAPHLIDEASIAEIGAPC